jgi:hypothetical protein
VPFVLNRAPTNVVAEVGRGIFTFVLALDTFYDPLGFDLAYSVEGADDATWLTIFVDEVRMVGVPTNADAGVVELSVVARRVVEGVPSTSALDRSAPMWFTIVVQPDLRPAPNPQFTVQLLDTRQRRVRRQVGDSVVVGGGDVTDVLPIAADGAAAVESRCFDGSERVLFVQSVARLLQLDPRMINLVGVRIDRGLQEEELDCSVTAVVSDNEGLNCSQAANRATELAEPQLEAVDRWNLALDDAGSTTLEVQSVAGNATACTIVGLTEVVPVTDNVASWVPFVGLIAACVVLLLAVILVALFRRREHKDAKGITGTFGPRDLIVLNEERRLPYDELSSLPNGVQRPTILAADLGPWPAPNALSPYGRDAPPYRHPPKYGRKPPKYVPAPPYPDDVRAIGAGFYGTGPNIDDQIEEIVVTHTTTTEEYYGGQQAPGTPPPPWRAPPDYNTEQYTTAGETNDGYDHGHGYDYYSDADADADVTDVYELEQAFLRQAERGSSRNSNRRLSVGMDVDEEDDMRGSTRTLGSGSARASPGPWSTAGSAMSAGSSDGGGARRSNGRRPRRSVSDSERSGYRSDGGGFQTGEDYSEYDDVDFVTSPTASFYGAAVEPTEIYRAVLVNQNGGGVPDSPAGFYGRAEVEGSQIRRAVLVNQDGDFMPDSSTDEGRSSQGGRASPTANRRRLDADRGGGAYAYSPDAIEGGAAPRAANSMGASLRDAARGLASALDNTIGGMSTHPHDDDADSIV